MPVLGFNIEEKNIYASGRIFGSVGRYEKITGKVKFAVNPDLDINKPITDLKSAKLNSSGLVEFISDFSLLVPENKNMSNQRLIVDVVNRGRPRFVSTINLAEAEPPDSTEMPPGDGYLFKNGYSVIAIGWQWDVLRNTNLLGLQAPEAEIISGHEKGFAMVEIRPDRVQYSRLLADRVHQPNPAAKENDLAKLYVRHWEDDTPKLINREEWEFGTVIEGKLTPSHEHIFLKDGFQPGLIYHLVYSPERCPVVGVGLLAVREIASFLRAPNALNPMPQGFGWIFGYGVSQTGRLLRHLLYLGLNTDEQGRKVYDGLLPHVAGSRMGEFNHRFAQPSVQSMPGFGHLPPFSDDNNKDPFSQESDGLLFKLREANSVPKIIYTNTSAEYWRGDGSLSHISMDGRKDLEPSEESRIYLFAGTQHIDSKSLAPPGSDAADGTMGQHPPNIIDYRPLLRAAFFNLDQWVTQNVNPPASNHPRLDDQTAVSREIALAEFPEIPDMSKPRPEFLWSLREIDLGNAASTGVGSYPPVEGRFYPCFVSAIDVDGNELSGIKLPDISVPLATYSGWNPRHPESGAPDQIIPMQGSTHYLPLTEDSKNSAKDPRRSVAERYETKDHYLRLVEFELKSLIDNGYVLDEDFNSIVETQSLRFDALSQEV